MYVDMNINILGYPFFINGIGGSLYSDWNIKHFWMPFLLMVVAVDSMLTGI